MDLEEENTFEPGMAMGRGTEPALQLTCSAIRPECLPEIQVSPNAFKADENSTSNIKTAAYSNSSHAFKAVCSAVQVAGLIFHLGPHK